MNVMGKKLRVFTSPDPTKSGVSGLVVMETAKTIVMETGDLRLRVEKQGTAFLVSGSKEVIFGEELIGRPEERLGRGRR
jgi:RNase P/RNase MRP subunit p29